MLSRRTGEVTEGNRRDRNENGKRKNRKERGRRGEGKGGRLCRDVRVAIELF